MAVHGATYGFVFKIEERGESDRVFSLFTREFGRIEVTGKAIRKIASKLRAGIELFSLSEVEFIQGKNQKTLTEAVATHRFPAVFQDPQKFFIAAEICRLIDCSVHGQEKDERIFALLMEVFARLNTTKVRKLTYYYFFWNFVSLLGYAPLLQEIKAPNSVIALIDLMLKKDWSALESMAISLETQKSFQKISESHLNQLP